jgi:Subtilisin inhibitor-like
MLRAAGTLTLCGALLLGASPASAAPHPKARFKIFDGVKGGAVKSVWLNCGPTGGDHPRARAACRLLKQVNGDPSKLNVSPKTACPQEIELHAVVMSGQWHGRQVRWSKAFANPCQMRAMTGALLPL